MRFIMLESINALGLQYQSTLSKSLVALFENQKELMNSSFSTYEKTWDFRKEGLEKSKTQFNEFSSKVESKINSQHETMKAKVFELVEKVAPQNKETVEKLNTFLEKQAVVVSDQVKDQLVKRISKGIDLGLDYEREFALLFKEVLENNVNAYQTQLFKLMGIKEETAEKNETAESKEEKQPLATEAVQVSPSSEQNEPVQEEVKAQEAQSSQTDQQPIVDQQHEGSQQN